MISTGRTNTKWLLNFSSSPEGGGLKRLEETAKWFDEKKGAVFIVNSGAMDYVSKYSKRNRFISIKQSKVRRFVADGNYLHKIIDEIGIPNVYFSYGIPVFYRVGRINWFHLSNALTLKNEAFITNFKRQIGNRVLGKRILRSMEHVQIASAESAFSLDLLRNAKGNTNPYCTYTVLKNGCDDELLNTKTIQSNDETSGNYAVTIGTYPYKRLDLALAVFHKLQREQPDLSRFKIIGNEKFINKKVRNDNMVEVLGFILDRKILYNTLRGAKYYISASRIENSSIAALEGLLLSENTVLSDIPSHREICRALLVKEIKVDDDNTFIMIKGGQNKSVNKLPSWYEILSKKVYTAERHLYTTNSIASNENIAIVNHS